MSRITLDGAASTRVIRAASQTANHPTDAHALSGTTACNSYCGSFTLNGDTIKTGPLVHSMRAARDPTAIAAEHVYLSDLQSVRTIENSNLDSLELTGSSTTHLGYDAQIAGEPQSVPMTDPDQPGQAAYEPTPERVPRT